MKIIIVGLVKNPQLKRIQEEGEKRGHKVSGCYASELVINASSKEFEPSLRGKPFDYDLIYLWAVGKRRWDWYTACFYLSKSKRTLVVNQKVIDPKSNYYLTSAIDYLKQTENKLLYPETVIISAISSLDSVINQFSFPLIVKKSEGRQGRGVFLVNDINDLKEKVDGILSKNPSVILREFIPNDGDIRIFTVGYKSIGAMKRTPTKKGEFRSNISLGGRGENIDLDDYPEVRNIAEKLSFITKTEIAGVDIMLHKETGEPYILEINPGPQFTGLEKYTGVNAALEIIKYFEKLLTK